MAAVNFPQGRAPHIGSLTDLPSYPWNHKNKHWIEPRFAEAVRARNQAPHDLLGLPVPGTNPGAPSWRNIVRVAEVPWLRDHVIQGNILYPAAGFVCLAIEAMKQQVEASGKSGDISGYRLRDVDILQALVVPDSPDGIEIQTSLGPVSEKIIASRGWTRFEVFSVTSDNRWTQHAQGLIVVEFSDSDSSGKLSSSPSLAADGDKMKLAMLTDSASTGHTRNINPADMFATLRGLGISHGPKFRNISEIVQAGRAPCSVAQIVVADTSVARDLPRAHVVHPTTLDSVVTAVYSALPGAGASEDSLKSAAVYRAPMGIESTSATSPVTACEVLLLDGTNDMHGLAGGHVAWSAMRVPMTVNRGHYANPVHRDGRFMYQSLGSAGPGRT